MQCTWVTEPPGFYFYFSLKCNPKHSAEYLKLIIKESLHTDIWYKFSQLAYFKYISFLRVQHNHLDNFNIKKYVFNKYIYEDC